jgi:hypothetical protein
VLMEMERAEERRVSGYAAPQPLSPFGLIPLRPWGIQLFRGCEVAMRWTSILATALSSDA